MTPTSFTRRNIRPAHRETPTHLYALGESVRLKGSFSTFPKSTEIYHVTGRLPPRGESLQYRIRSDSERYERVTTEDSLEPVPSSSGDESTTLLERTFGHGQGTKAQQSGDPKTETGEDSSEGGESFR
jgi:hypothetical protein